MRLSLDFGRVWVNAKCFLVFGSTPEMLRSANEKFSSASSTVRRRLIKVQHSDLFQTLQEKCLDDNDIQLLNKLYWNQTATMKVNDNRTDEIYIQWGVRQGYVLWPSFFKMYLEHIFNKALQDQTEEIITND